MRFINGRQLFGALALTALFFGVTGTAQAQQGTITGRVIDEATQLPVAGAQVLIVGTTRGSLTNQEGRYRIDNVTPGSVELRVRMIGYTTTTQTVTVGVGETSVADFALTASAIPLDAVVVTVTGAQAKREIGNVIATIDAAQVVQEAPVTNTADLLSGRASNVQVLQSSGTIGTGTRVRIRGLASLSLDNEPLYYVDGIRVESGQGLGFNLGGQTVSRINDINPEEVESIDVVKGPSAATLYGTEAASGVIRITTKRGRPGPARWSFYVEQGLVVEPNTYPVNFYSHGRVNATGAATQCLLTSAALPAATAGSCTIDSLTTFNVLEDDSTTPFGTGYRQQYGVQVSGGSEQLQYFFAGEWEKETGVLEMPQSEQTRLLAERVATELPEEHVTPNALRKGAFRANLNALLSNKATLTVRTGVVTSRVRLPQNDNNVTGLLGSAYFGKGRHFTTPAPTGGLAQGREWGFHLPGDVFSRTVTQDVNRFTNSIQASFTPTTFLQLRGTAGLDYTSRIDGVIQLLNEGPAFAIRRLGAVGEDRISIYQWTLDLGATGTVQLTPDISSKTSVGVQYFQDLFNRNEAFAERLAPGGQTLQSGSTPFVGEATAETITLGSYVEEVFGYKDRLFLTGAVRLDENSAFGQDFQSAVYPKASASWLISEEPFFPVSSVLNTLRFRAAIGGSGLQPGSTDALRFFTPTTATISATDVPAVTDSSVGNTDLKPERSTEIEIGTDATLFNNRVGLEFTYYHKKTKDALIRRRIAPSLGSTTDRLENIGEVLNKGVEVVVNLRAVETQDVQWDLSFSGSTNTNEIIDLGPGVQPIRGTRISQIPGYPLFGWWMRPILGFSDANGNGIIEATEVTTGDTTVFLGYSTPRYTLSINSGLTLFNNRIRIGGQVDWRAGFGALNLTEFFRCTSGAANNCRWINDPTTPLADQAKAVAARTNFRTEAGFLEEGDFIKFRELSLTFFAPENWARAVGSNRLSLTVTGRNLGTITNYRGVDPEVNGNGQSDSPIDFLTAPPVRHWTFRVNYGL